MAEDYQDRSWERIKVVKYPEEKVVDDNTSYDCLVEWNDIIQSHSWVNFLASSVSDSTLTISFARKNYNLDKMIFCHPIKYCKSRPSTIISKAQKVSAKTRGIKYRFGM
jgi:hypothetical protein